MTEDRPLEVTYTRAGRRKRLDVVLRPVPAEATDQAPGAVGSIELAMELAGGRPFTDRHVEEMEHDLGPDDRQGPDDGGVP
jgi:hypothetical protein